MSDQLREDLEALHEWLSEESHWCKGSGYKFDADNHVEQTCLMGGVEYVIGSENSLIREARFSKVNNALQDQLPAGYRYLIMFNDADMTTHSDVVDLIQRTIKATVEEGE